MISRIGCWSYRGVPIAFALGVLCTPETEAGEVRFPVLLEMPMIGQQAVRLSRPSAATRTRGF